MNKIITISETEAYDEETNKFIYVKPCKFVIKHTLVSISKWEAKFKKPFLSDKPMEVPELIEYVKCMTITQNVDPNVYKILSTEQLNDILAYMNDKMSATWFSEHSKKQSKNGEVITSELIYYWMTAMNIPFTCEKWHLNRLLTLIRIAGEKNQPPKKMNKNDILKQNKSLNAARKARIRTRG